VGCEIHTSKITHHMQLGVDAKMCISNNSVQKPLAKSSLSLLARASYAVVLTDAHPAALLLVFGGPLSGLDE
jgi:hypothetical protein